MEATHPVSGKDLVSSPSLAASQDTRERKLGKKRIRDLIQGIVMHSVDIPSGILTVTGPTEPLTAEKMRTEIFR